jgi:DNA-binding transcriptional regulator YdaS (Cro superfamily)
VRLGAYLELTGISQTAFAATVALRQPSISRYISGTQNPSATTTRKIQSATQGAVGPGDWAPEKKIRRPQILSGW